MNRIFNLSQSFLVTLAALLGSGIAVSAQTIAVPASTAQTPAAPQSPESERAPARKASRRLAPPARVTVIPSQAEVAPQVVTIVHRLSGVQMLRLLLRRGEGGTIATMDPSALTNNAHASIIAGWLLDDGKTIAARLPQAAAEIELSDFPFPRPDLRNQTPEAAAVARAAVAVSRIEPDLTVVTREGRRLRARYVGLDGQTGLSVLQINGAGTSPPDVASTKKISEGQRVQLFAPAPTTPPGEPLPGITYVQVGKTDAKIVKVDRTKSGTLDRLTVRAAKLSPGLIGGVVCDESGNTLGIVEAVEGNDAQIVTVDTVRAATRRVLERQTNVPRPLLGVRGEPVELTPRADFLAQGWREDQLNDLIKRQIGILLTSILPGTPAAMAQLRAGDVIVSVNKDEVKTAEEFSALLGQIGCGERVNFTVRRPTTSAPVSVDVKLGSSFEPLFEYKFEMPVITMPRTAFQGLGVETMALSRKSALQLGAPGGLLVVTVKPRSAAARAGVREGDVIESIDGRSIRQGVLVSEFNLDRQKKHVVSVIRDKEKKQVILEPVE